MVLPRWWSFGEFSPFAYLHFLIFQWVFMSCLKNRNRRTSSCLSAYQLNRLVMWVQKEIVSKQWSRLEDNVKRVGDGNIYKNELLSHILSNHECVSLGHQDFKILTYSLWNMHLNLESSIMLIDRYGQQSSNDICESRWYIR